MILVIAPRYEEAKEWAFEHAEEYGLTHRTGWKYVIDLSSVIGMARDSRFVVLRSYALNQNQIHLVLAVRRYLGEGHRL